MNINKIKTFQVTAKYSDFKEEASTWQQAFFALMSMQNTYDFAYDIKVGSGRDHEAYLFILLHSGANIENLKEWLTYHGYRNLKIDSVTVGEIETYDMDVDYIAEA